MFVDNFKIKREIEKLCEVKMGKYTSPEKIQLVIFHREKGKTIKDICAIVNMKKSTVYDIIKRCDNEDRIALMKSPGRPRKLTEHEERIILRKVKVNPKLSAPKLTTEVAREFGKVINPETVRRLLRENEYNGRVARRKPYISLCNKKKRLNFAEEYLLKPDTYWYDVLFADESKFNIFSSDGRVMVWRKKNQELHPSNLKATVKHGGQSVMVWGCMTAFGVGDLVFIDGKLNAEKYRDLLRTHLRQSADKLGILDSFKFYEDNDPKHRARSVQEWLLYNCPRVLHPPPQSPDLNPIENLWDELDRKVHTRPIHGLHDLRQRLAEEWYKLSPEYLHKIVQNMPNRLRWVVKQKGNPTKY